MSQAWDRFVESLEGPGRDWVNSLDLEALSELEGEERERATQRLLSSLKIGDPRVSRALGQLRDPRGHAALEAHLSVASGQDRVATAVALLQMGRPEAAIQAIEQGLEDSSFSVANEALKAAEQLGERGIHPLLAAAARHPQGNIRVGAAMCALYLAGVNPSPGSWNHREVLIGLADAQRELRSKSFAAVCTLLGIEDRYEGPRP